MKELFTALISASAQLRNIKHDAANPFHKNKYTTLEAVLETVKPVLAEHDLAIVQYPDGDSLVTRIVHISGEEIATSAKLLLVKNDMQGLGSAITYMRRYAIMSMLGITGTDDDANEAVAPPKKKQEQPAPAPQAKTMTDKQLDECLKGFDDCSSLEQLKHVYTQTLKFPWNEVQRMALQDRKDELKQQLQGKPSDKPLFDEINDPTNYDAVRN